MITSNTILKELNEYLSSCETSRVYYYDTHGMHLNSKLLKCKIIKEHCLLLKKWLEEDSIIKAKNISLFVDGRRSIVPFHYMYKNKFNSTILNEDCIFDNKFFKKTLKHFRTNKSYSCAFIIIKPGATMSVPNAYCQPYVMCELHHLEGCASLATDYYTSAVSKEQPLHRFYYRSNINLHNRGNSNAVLFVNCNFMYNKFDVSDSWESNYAIV